MHIVLDSFQIDQAVISDSIVIKRLLFIRY